MAQGFFSETFRPARVILTSFVLTILAGAGLLMLPQATTAGITVIDALFTATSAVCVTGLIVISTPGGFSPFGQGVILVLIQIGGLGYMTFATFVALALGRRIGIAERVMLKEALNIHTHQGMVKFLKWIFLFVFASEAVGALALTLCFVRDYAPSHALWLGVFHSVSAFNNAGFSLFDESLMGYAAHPGVNLAVIALIVLGGLGFITVLELRNRMLKHLRRERITRLSLHTRVVLTATGLLTAVGAIVFFLNESSGAFRAAGLGTGGSVLAALFSSVTTRTAGFNTVDFAALAPSTLFLVMLLMFVGASPGSTGGGIKTTTAAVVMLHVWATLRGRHRTVVFGRSIPRDMVARSAVIVLLGGLYVAAAAFAIIEIDGLEFKPALFEVVSAFATVGLSLGTDGVSYAAFTSEPSKLILTVTMLLGRLGPLTVFSLLVGQKVERFEYPEGRIVVG